MSNIIYKPYVFTDKITGSTNTYTSTSPQIDVDIDINKYSTFNLAYFDKNLITKYDIIYSLIDYIDINIDKFFLNVLIVDVNNIFDDIVLSGLYCVKFYYNDSVDYILINVINEKLIYESVLLYQDLELINEKITTITTTITKTPLIYYHYSYDDTWKGGGLNIPDDVSLQLYHNNYTGWTINQLRDLFLDYVYDYYEQIVDIDKVNVKLYKQNSSILESSISSVGVYKIIFSYFDMFDNCVVNTINNINVIQNTPIIYFKDYILSSYLSGNTNDYTGVTSNFIPDITVDSGFIFNLNGFSNNEITKNDIIHYLIEYVRGDNDEIIDKYSVNITIAKPTIYKLQNVYESVFNPGIFCIQVLKENIFGDKTIKYFIMKVVSNYSVYSEGFWQDNKVWIDSVVWLDHPIVGT